MVTDTSALRAAKIISLSMAGCTQDLVSLDCNKHGDIFFDTVASCTAFVGWGGTMNVNMEGERCFRVDSALNSANLDVDRFFSEKRLAFLPYTGEWKGDFERIEDIPSAVMDGYEVQFSFQISQDDTTEYNQILKSGSGAD